MKKYLLIITMLTSICAKAVTIEYCYQKAKENYPLIKQYQLIELTRDYNLQNANKAYLPQISFSAKASYQSEVTEIPISVPGIKSINKDQYSMALDVSQVIWDGGFVKSQKDITEANSTLSKAKIEVDLYAINERVNDLYFGILLLDSKINQNKILQEELKRNYNLISSGIENGVANEADLDAVKVEQLKSMQTETTLKASRNAYVNVLSDFIGEKISAELEKPLELMQLTSEVEIKRPEIEMFNAQYNTFSAQKKLIKADYMPKLGLFVTGGYANPALNMLKPEFSAYYIGGVRLSWNFGSLYTQKNSRKILDANMRSVEVNKETFLFNTNLQASIEQSEVAKQKDLLKHDDEIIRLRNNVKTSTEIKVKNGIMTISDLLREVHAEDLAKQEKINHEIELIQAIYNLKHTKNN